MPDREKTIGHLYDCLAASKPENMWVFVRKVIVGDAIALLKEQEMKAGKWIPVTNGRGGMECSICHDYAPSYQSCEEYLSKYCPNCGAKMESR